MVVCKNFLIRNVFLFLSFFIISCCSTNNIHDNQKPFNIQEESVLENAKLSAVKITGAIHIGIKEKTSTSTTMTEEIDTYSGSGVIVGQVDSGTLVLTAGHVCHHPSKNIALFHFPYYDENIHDIFTDYKFVVTDIDDKPHVAIIVAISKESDTCILLATPINYPVIEISDNEPRPSERVYSISYPKGLWQRGYNPVIEGFYIGSLTFKDATTAAFSLRSAPGCSGGLIIDFDGKLIGMIHSIYYEFDQLTFGASVSQIKEIIEFSNFIYKSNKERFQTSLTKEFIIFQTP